jgi:hypothetical protein
MDPSKAELEAAINEENDAMLEFAKLQKAVITLEKDKNAARHRLMTARDAKRALMNDLMSYEV